MRCTLEYWHPGGDRRWSRRDEVDLPVGTQAPAKGWPDLPAFAPYHGPDGWVLRFRQVGEGLVVMLVNAAPEGSGRWEGADDSNS